MYIYLIESFTYTLTQAHMHISIIFRAKDR